MAGSGGGGTISAAGAVVSRGDGGEVEVALVHRPRYDDWSLPKGKLEPGEHVLHAAVREVVEETGLRVVLGRTLPASTYEVVGGVKRVSYWAARCAGSEQFVPGPEVDQMAWLEMGAARERLSYERDRVILDAFAARPAVTSPLILLRHAEAGQKLLTGEQNLARPLDARGVADAQVLADLLACYGRCRVLSSAAERCIATVRPYAAAVGSRIEVTPALTVPADGRADVVLELAARLAVSGEPALVCAHRENLPPLIRAAFAALGAEPPQEPPLAKGAFWVLQAAGGTLASAERHDVETLASPVVKPASDCRCRAVQKSVAEPASRREASDGREHAREHRARDRGPSRAVNRTCRARVPALLPAAPAQRVRLRRHVPVDDKVARRAGRVDARLVALAA